MQFEQAVELVNGCPPEVQINTEEKLMLYAYFKQSTLGDCRTDRPSFYQLVEKTKYDAYFGLKGMSVENAKINYIKLVRSILERVKHEYPLIAQQLNSIDAVIDSATSPAEADTPEKSVTLKLVQQNKTLSTQLKWMKRLSLILVLVIIFQFKLPFRKLLQVYFNKR